MTFITYILVLTNTYSSSTKSKILLSLCNSDGLFDTNLFRPKTFSAFKPHFIHHLPNFLFFIRKNSTHLVILKLGGLREVNRILSEYGLGVTKDQLLSMYEYATLNKFDCLIIANEEPRESKFRKNFSEILDPSAYGKD